MPVQDRRSCPAASLTDVGGPTRDLRQGARRMPFPFSMLMGL
jgi:hypothetical protein